MQNLDFDFIVIGSGPAGQKAAVQAAKLGQTVALVEQGKTRGGACVFHGTIPSKTLRETASIWRRSQRLLGKADSALDEIAPLMTRVRDVVDAHASFIDQQLDRNAVQVIRGRASFVDSHTIEVRSRDGSSNQITAHHIMVATGSRPRAIPHIAIDHEHILDSDSLLSVAYLPKSLLVVGGGVIAMEYATTFANLGVEVTVVDKGERPLAFMDEELVWLMVEKFEELGGTFLPNQEVQNLNWDGISSLRAELKNGHVIQVQKAMIALGRVANVETLDLPQLNLELTPRGQIPVNEYYQTSIPHIYAIGDVIGFPSLAATSMEQGRRAVCHALGVPTGNAIENTPVGIYAIPELASVGLTPEQVAQKHGVAKVGRAKFTEVARAHIKGTPAGLLKLVADEKTLTLRGVHVVGESATELIHMGQIALAAQWRVEQFVDTIFNFPTMAEAYRIAAFDLLNRGEQVLPAPPR